MTRVDFYAGADDPAKVAAALAQKAVRAGHRVWILTRDAEHSRELDARLWAEPDGGFLPHVTGDHPLAAKTPVVIDHRDEAVPHEDVLINLSGTEQPVFSRFERLLEIVPAEGPAVAAARERFRRYRDRGYPLQSFDLRRG